jgi:hypothetical protein
MLMLGFDITVYFTRPSYFLLLALLLFESQAPVDEYVGKDWRTINFRQDNAIHLNKNSYCVFMCQRANIEECQYAVCHVCHEEQSKTQKRTRGRVLSDDDLMETCHHELRNLQLCADIWWCTKDYLGGQHWLGRAKGCVFCERMFTVGEK